MDLEGNKSGDWYFCAIECGLIEFRDEWIPMKVRGRRHRLRKEVLHFGTDLDKGAEPGFVFPLSSTFFSPIEKILAYLVNWCLWLCPIWCILIEFTETVWLAWRRYAECCVISFFVAHFLIFPSLWEINFLNNMDIMSRLLCFVSSGYVCEWA